MKRIAAFVAAATLLFSHALAAVDLSSMTLEELIALRQQIGLEIASRPEVKAVTVPVGVWEIGKDIPAGHWTITMEKGHAFPFSGITYCDALDETGKSAEWSLDGIFYSAQLTLPGSDYAYAQESIDLDMKSGMYFIVDYSPVVLTPFTGKPDLGFDW